MSFRRYKVRSDIIFSKTYERTGIRHIVADVSSGAYYSLSHIQFEILKHFQDFPHSSSEASSYFAQKNGIEIPPESIEGFLENMRKKQLLELSHHNPLNAGTLFSICSQLKEKLRSDVKKYWQKSPATDIESALVSEVFFQLRVYNPYKALEELMIANRKYPDNVLMKSLYNTLHDGLAFALTDKTVQAKLNMDMNIFAHFNPMPTFDRYRKLIFLLLSPSSLVIFLALLVAGIIFLINSDRPQWTNFRRITLLTYEYYITTYIISYVHIFFHEMGHALVCYRLGAQVKRIGFSMLWGIIPMYFADVTDSYRLQLWPRTLVLLAGIGGQTVLGLIGIYAWLFMPEHSYVSLIGEFLTLGWLTSSFFNLFPFMLKLDGYYIFSDWTGIENLWSRSREFASQKIKTILPWKEVTSVEKPTDLNFRPMERIIFYFYTLTSITLLTMNMTLMPIGMIVYFDTLPLLGRISMFTFLAYMGLRLVNWAKSSFLDSQDETKVQRVWVKSKVIALLLLAILCLLPTNKTIEAPAKVMADKQMPIISPYSGIVGEVLTRDGQPVKKDDLIIKIINHRLLSDYQKSKYRLEGRFYDYQLEMSGPTSIEKEAYYTDIEIEQIKISLLEEQLRAQKRGYEQGIVSKTELMQSMQKLESAQTRLEYINAKANRKIISNHLLATKVSKKEVDIAAYDLKDLKEKISRMELRAPISGIVYIKKPTEVLGKNVAINEPVAEVLSEDKIISFHLPEYYLNSFAVNDSFNFETQAGHRVSGQILSISELSEIKVPPPKFIANVFPKPTWVKVVGKINESDMKTILSLPYGYSGKVKVYGKKTIWIYDLAHKLLISLYVNFWSIF